MAMEKIEMMLLWEVLKSPIRAPITSVRAVSC
jgi:hypothetical protein